MKLAVDGAICPDSMIRTVEALNDLKADVELDVPVMAGGTTRGYEQWLA